MNSVHFCSLLCPDYDSDLLHHWSKHYYTYGFDSYCIYLHSPFGNTDLLHDTAKLLKAVYGFECRIIEGDKFGNGSLRASCIGERVAQLHRDDYMVTADSDELQDVPLDYKEIANTCDYMRGRHLDCYDTTLHDALPSLPLDMQYPLRGNVEGQILEKYADVRTAQSWPRARKEKILCCKMRYKVAFAGSHFLFEFDPINPPIVYPDSFSVLHYTWRGSIVKRMAGKDYFHAPHIWYVKKFFSPDGNVIIDKEMQGIIEMEEALQKEKGWNAHAQ